MDSVRDGKGGSEMLPSFFAEGGGVCGLDTIVVRIYTERIVF